MAPTPYPRNLMHSGAALPLTLKESLAVPPTGDITLVVDGNATSKGWPTIPAGESIVVTVGRGTLYESKYLVSSLVASTDQTSLLVLEVDRAYDGTTPVNAPSGTIVEHTISATEMQQINTHMRSRSQHGADGDLVDTGSAQTLNNKTLNTPLITAPSISGGTSTAKNPGFRQVPVGAVILWPTSTVPAGWLVCNGQTFSATTYPALAALFPSLKVPDMTNAYVKGGEPTVGDTPTARAGANAKKISIAQLPAHDHGTNTSFESANHSHGMDFRSQVDGYHNHALDDAGGAQVGGPGKRITGAGTFNNSGTLHAGSHDHRILGSTAGVSANHSHVIPSQGGGADFNVEPQNVVMRYIICATDA